METRIQENNANIQDINTKIERMEDRILAKIEAAIK